MKFSKLLILLIAGILIGFSGCTTHKGLQIVYPEYNEVVADLHPTLEWEAVSDPKVTYDLIAYELEEINPVLYEEGLKDATYKIEKELKPDTLYRWSVRRRKGKDISEWTKQETHVFTGISYHRRVKFFRFLTPENQ